jgi:hypothetical protein
VREIGPEPQNITVEKITVEKITVKKLQLKNYSYS